MSEQRGQQATDRLDARRRAGRTGGDGGGVPSWLATATAWTWRMLVLLVGAGAILYVLTRLYLVTLPIIAALVLATLLVPPARWLERHRWPSWLAATVSVVGGLALVSGVIAALTPAFVAETQQLQPTVTQGIERIYRFLEGSFGWDRQEVADLLNQGVQLLQEQWGQLAQQAFMGAAIAVQAIAAIALTLVLLFFFVKDGDQLVGWTIGRIPDRYRATVRAVGARAWVALAGFVRGTATIALIDALGVGIGLAILQVPLALPIAVLVFLGAFIPVIGAFVTGLLAVLVALASGGLQTALIVLAIIIGVQQIEGNVLQPVIMRRAVALHPVVVLAALTAGAALLGIVGAFLAVPVAAVAAAVGNELRLRHEAGLISPDTGEIALPSHEPLGGPRRAANGDEDAGTDESRDADEDAGAGGPRPDADPE